VFVNPELLNQVGPLVIKTVIGLVITGLLGAIMWPIKRASKEWKALKEEQSAIHAELVQQRENHLTHIEKYSKDQVDLLGKVVDTLGEIRISQAEMTGYCKANSSIGCGPRLRRRTAKK